MTKAVLRAVAVVAMAIPTLAMAQDVVDTTPYVVDSGEFPYTIYPSNHQMDNTYPWRTTTVPFSPTRSYTSTEQTTVVNDETAITRGMLMYDWFDGSQVVDINQATIPEATQQNVQPPSEVKPLSSGTTTMSVGTQSTTPFNRTYTRTERFGNNLFGAGYSIHASITATPATSTAAKRVEALAEGRVFGLAFNNEREIIRGRAYISGQQGASSSGTAQLFAMGQTIWSANLVQTFAPAPINWSRTFFAVSKTFMVGPVPLNVRASVAGGVKFSASGEISPVVAKLNASTGGWANGTLSASVGIVVAGFGVEGSLSLINVDLATYGELIWPFCTLNWALRADLRLNAMSGTVKLYAKVRFLFFSKTWRVTIAQWGGITRNWSLLNISGQQNLGLCN